jgi:hypothetical protein
MLVLCWMISSVSRKQWLKAYEKPSKWLYNRRTIACAYVRTINPTVYAVYWTVIMQQWIWKNIVVVLTPLIRCVSGKFSVSSSKVRTGDKRYPIDDHGANYENQWDGNKELNAINPCNADALLYQCSTGWITLSSVSLCAYHISVCIQSRLYRCSPVSSVCTVNGKQVGVYSTRWNQHEMIVDT